MSTLTQQWLEQGRQEGLQMGEAMFLIRLLERRFGSLSELCQKRIEAMDGEMLLKWGERVLSARNLEECSRSRLIMKKIMILDQTLKAQDPASSGKLSPQHNITLQDLIL